MVNFFLMSLCLFQLSNYAHSEPSTPKILVLDIPLGKSHQFIMKELFNYTKSKGNFEYHIISHNADKVVWEDTTHIIYEYGNVEKLKYLFEKGIEANIKSPIFSFKALFKPVKYAMKNFLEEKVVEKLKKHKFELIISDFPSYLLTYLKEELKIPKSMFIFPTCLPSFFNAGLEINPSYIPSFGSTLSDDMSFFQRLENTLKFYAFKGISSYLHWDQRSMFKKFNISLPFNNFEEKSVVLSQCVDGIHYPTPKPPNFDNLGAVLPRPAKKIEDIRITNILEKFEKNIYISQGTLMNVVDFSEIIQLLKSFPEIGFILAFKKEYLDNKEFPSNAVGLEWVPQNDLLGHPKINAFITHGGLNSILESIYHEKPMICLGFGLDQVSNGALIEARKIGIRFLKDEVNLANLKNALEKVLSDEELKKNISKLSKFIKIQKGKEKFHDWLVTILELGYDNLLINAYLKKPFYQLYNLDLVFFFFCLLFLLRKVSKFLFRERIRKIKTE